MSRYSEEDLLKVWQLLNDLVEQNNNNRAVIEQLKARADNAKPMSERDFLCDDSMSTFQMFHSELEAFAAHLVSENQALQHENKQLNTLLKDYEQTLEMVMGKFRGVAHDLSLHSYYTSLLQTLQTAHSSAQLHDDTSLSLLLTRLSALIRSALRSASGEEGNDINLPNLSPASAFGFPGSGGYRGTEGQGDWALAREMEIERLELENRELRAMLMIAQEHAGGEADKEGEVKGRPEPVAERKHSLTIEQLEADAEREADILARAEEKPPLAESVLGFRADASNEAPPGDVFDETEFEAV